MSTPRLAIFISGGGRTALNIADQIDNGQLDAQIAVVVASRPCAGHDRCKERGLPVMIERGEIPEARLTEILDEARADLVCLAGYLKLMPIPAGWQGRVLNIHPALLPKHGGPGMFGDRVHRSVLESGEHISGCTVHICDGEFDRGPIVVQKSCEVLPGDTVDTLAERVFCVECAAYPEAIRTTLKTLGLDADA
ncbi:MAG: phosphoribosylglycinamide formyltransferase [Phycisphaera sp.]|nr:MAG: phosphoribosylglycinamide formyltransferase [Phycisphaera sp.]